MIEPMKQYKAIDITTGDTESWRENIKKEFRYLKTYSTHNRYSIVKINENFISTINCDLFVNIVVAEQNFDNFVSLFFGNRKVLFEKKMNLIMYLKNIGKIQKKFKLKIKLFMLLKMYQPTQ